MFLLLYGPCWCPCTWAPTWRLHTKLCKFGWNTFPHNARMNYRTDLNLGEVVYFYLFLFKLFIRLFFSLHHIFSTQHTLHEIQYIHYLQYNTIIYSTNNTNTILITLHTSNKTNTLKYIKKNFIRLPTNITHKFVLL